MVDRTLGWTLVAKVVLLSSPGALLHHSCSSVASSVHGWRSLYSSVSSCFATLNLLNDDWALAVACQFGLPLLILPLYHLLLLHEPLHFLEHELQVELKPQTLPCHGCQPPAGPTESHLAGYHCQSSSPGCTKMLLTVSPSCHRVDSFCWIGHAWIWRYSWLWRTPQIKSCKDHTVVCPLLSSGICGDENVVCLFPETIEQGTDMPRFVFEGKLWHTPKLLKAVLSLWPVVGGSEVERWEYPW